MSDEKGIEAGARALFQFYGNGPPSKMPKDYVGMNLARVVLEAYELELACREHRNPGDDLAEAVEQATAPGRTRTHAFHSLPAALRRYYEATQKVDPPFGESWCPACRRGDHEHCYDPDHLLGANWPDPPCSCRGACVDAMRTLKETELTEPERKAVLKTLEVRMRSEAGTFLALLQTARRKIEAHR
jgi:hypothetical protein